MARATLEDVKTILPSDTQLTDPQIQASIEAAHFQVNKIAESCAAGLPEDHLTQIEIWLSAHNCASMENTLTLSSENDACSGSTASYGFKFGEGVKGTPYGMTANSLSCGCLAELDKAPVNLFTIGCA